MIRVEVEHANLPCILKGFIQNIRDREDALPFSFVYQLWQETICVTCSRVSSCSYTSTILMPSKTISTS